VRSQGYQQPMSPASTGHASDGSSTSDNKVGGKKIKFKFHCKLYKGIHRTYHYPHIEEDSKLLNDNVVSQQKPLVTSQDSSPTQPMVEEAVNMIRSSFDPNFLSGSHMNITDVFFVNS